MFVVVVVYVVPGSSAKLLRASARARAGAWKAFLEVNGVRCHNNGSRRRTRRYRSGSMPCQGSGHAVKGEIFAVKDVSINAAGRVASRCWVRPGWQDNDAAG